MNRKKATVLNNYAAFHADGTKFRKAGRMSRWQERLGCGTNHGLCGTARTMNRRSSTMQQTRVHGSAASGCDGTDGAELRTYNSILCRCSGLRTTAFYAAAALQRGLRCCTTAFYAAAADFVAARRHRMPLQRTSLLHDGIECRCSGLRKFFVLQSSLKQRRGPKVWGSSVQQRWTDVTKFRRHEMPPRLCFDMPRCRPPPSTQRPSRIIHGLKFANGSLSAACGILFC
jgi:hypothetical protein